MSALKFNQRSLAETVAALTLAACGLAASAQPIVVQSFTRNLSGGQARGFVAQVDLTDPTVQIVVTPPLAPGAASDSVLVPTDQWQSTSNVDLAVNANYFSTLTGNTSDIIGLSMSDGIIVSTIRQFGSAPDPAIMFRADRFPTIGTLSQSDLATAYDAIAGVGPSNTDSIPGTFLITDGINTGATARVQPTTRNPRTAVGINQSGTSLIIAVVDGRQTGWSVGMTLPELATLMLERGAWRAINLDGGGSSSFIYAAPNQPRIQNRPSDGAHRPVANHLGIRLNPTPPPPAIPVGDRADRPIRGVWLRPPALYSTLVSQLPLLAEAGITDLYLETFYHGITTNDSNVFQDRFSTDYLAQTIRDAARHNIRVHAWLESGYWQFGTTGEYNFASNPEWRVRNTVTGAPGGDQPQQIFANLTHPGVQAKMRAYCAELAGYAGLWGIQTDYHRFPLDNDTADIYPAPWSYDVNSQVAMFDLYNTNINTTARKPGDPFWTQFVAWRREGISQAANQMHQGINSVNPDVTFSAAVFAKAMTDSAQLTKMQDWPSWASRNYIDVVVPMAYGFSTSSIQSDLIAARSNAAGKKVVAGLAITSGHPAITPQMNTAKGQQVEDVIFWEGNVLIGSAAMRTELKNWLLANATKQQGDFNNDLYVDARDFRLFRQIFNTNRVMANTANRRYDLNTDGWIDFADQQLFAAVWLKNTFGEDGTISARDRATFENTINQTAGTAPGVLHLYDLDANGVVNSMDRMIMQSFTQQGIGLQKR
jgi:uncharacterized lipoprotein YddW (UPF0748 family)